MNPRPSLLSSQYRTLWTWRIISLLHSFISPLLSVQHRNLWRWNFINPLHSSIFLLPIIIDCADTCCGIVPCQQLPPHLSNNPWRTGWKPPDPVPQLQLDVPPWKK
uniref:Uncharacterized protein n=1 Tax=Cacopsylla melanoneura TaxID=428564 RepID=A0A8D8PUN9_9HEMI